MRDIRWWEGNIARIAPGAASIDSWLSVVLIVNHLHTFPSLLGDREICIFIGVGFEVEGTWFPNTGTAQAGRSSIRVWLITN